MRKLGGVPSEKLQTELKHSLQVLNSVSQLLTVRPDLQNAVDKLMKGDSMSRPRSESAVEDTVLVRLALHVIRTVVVNGHSVQELNSELKRRAANAN